MRSTCGGRRGVTLIELLVALTILAIASTVVVLGWSVNTDSKVAPDETSALIASERREAIRSGRARRLVFRLHNDESKSTPPAPAFATLLPDGSVIADPRLRRLRLNARALPPTEER